MSRQRLVKSATFAAFVTAAMSCAGCGRAAAQRTEPSRPNIIVIALDDVGFADLGAFGSEIATPNIDAIAASGLKYVRFDTNAVCSATRASFFTGQNAATVRMAALASDRSAADPDDRSAYKGEIPIEVPFLSQVLQRSGYATLAIGKWHLSPSYETGKAGSNASFPLQRGFDYFYGFKMGWTDQYHPQLFEGNDPVRDPYRDGYFLSADLVTHAIQRMQANRQQAPDKPMFLYLAMPVAHAPVQAPRADIDRYVKTYEKGWDAIREERFGRQKALGVIPSATILPPRENGDPAWGTLTAKQRRVYTRYMADYAAYLHYGDEQIGRLIEFLKTSGLETNTIVVVFSDNGAASETKTGGFRRPYGDQTPLDDVDRHLDEMGGPATQPLYPRPWAYAGGTPLRRYKLWPFLGGIRTPLIVKWAGTIADAGSFRRQYVHVIDIAPTLLDAAGARFGDVAGKSFLATITNAEARSPRTVQFFELWGNRAITDGEWRAVSFHKPGTSFDTDQWVLFNTAADPSESTDVSAANAARLKRMQALWEEEAKRYGDLPLAEAPASRAQGFADEFKGPQK